MVNLNLRGRIALVTSGESDLGAACGFALADPRVKVGASDFYDEQAGEASAKAARGHGRRSTTVRADVGREDQVEAAFGAVADALGGSDIRVNSAGKNMSDVAVVDMSTDRGMELTATDLTGSILTSHRFVRDLKAVGQPAVSITIISIHSTMMRAGGADYDAAKGGQRNLTGSLALEVAADRITVNAIAPGMILTPMNLKALHDLAVREKKAVDIPLKRAGQPDEVAGVAVLLASPAGAYVTGPTVTIDGGLSLLLGQEA